MYDQTDGIPNRVLEVLTPMRSSYDFLDLQNPVALIYDLRAHGHHEVADYLSDGHGNFDREKFENVVIAIMRRLRKDRIS